MKTNMRRALCGIISLCLGTILRGPVYAADGGDEQEIRVLQAQLKQLQKNGDVLHIDVKKKPTEVVANGPVLIYRYDMSGSANYQWIVVPSEKSRDFVENLLKTMQAVGLVGVGVKTLNEIKNEKPYAGEEDEHARYVQQMITDLQTYSAVVESYENRSDKLGRE